MTSIAKPGRVDFHLHSYASNATTYYAANAFAIETESTLQSSPPSAMAL